MPYFLAGKTGTTNEFRDAWFAGFSPNLLCLVWVGYDKGTLLGKRESGAIAALPIWMEFMSKALPLYPNDDFAVSDTEEEGNEIRISALPDRCPSHRPARE